MTTKSIWIAILGTMLLGISLVTGVACGPAAEDDGLADEDTWNDDDGEDAECQYDSVDNAYECGWVITNDTGEVYDGSYVIAACAQGADDAECLAECSAIATDCFNLDECASANCYTYTTDDDADDDTSDDDTDDDVDDDVADDDTVDDDDTTDDDTTDDDTADDDTADDDTTDDDTAVNCDGDLRAALGECHETFGTARVCDGEMPDCWRACPELSESCDDWGLCLTALCDENPWAS
ncbi:MAG: hypothetical protein IT350_13490 [Deltaproteobacteria bacterium]|nr:hypothetical protein [Deltaproteobacteria bacterium]